ncbi:hypothetical protein EJ05DRAFT_492880 [Pseudovirgaria hyperparasitica]|uniref:alpha-glucosidase n=1 Tax=Pseudovirgaria hyperparasitica TaxID=470096 RepID=A0A6A6W7Z4_9PEZI|nr:uncharacterized protein EJ05DRAFT_492880 [Pseudovirgaria hyperparasitica]KAF2758763.1 hypothetical protein EJ05DRAFT_492880 [Pseudovirgaria hyperparasitica]
MLMQDGGREARVPNVLDPASVDAQTVCPGYRLADAVTESDTGMIVYLTLAGEACNVYGTDIGTLKLVVEYQTAHRLRVNISPAFLDASNTTQYLPPEDLLPLPAGDGDAEMARSKSDMEFQFAFGSGDTFAFKVKRKSTGDILFDMTGAKLVFENQFVEFASKMPRNYNLYGLGEHIHSLHLGNDYAITMFNGDIGDPIDANLYGTHPFYLDTRYYKKAGEREMTLLESDEHDTSAEYVSYSHGVYMRNAHAQEILLKETNITWRTIGGSVDLYFFDGPNQADVTKQYQEVIGLPAMHQYWTLGYHQSKWGYGSWAKLQEVVNKMKENNIPLETIWSDIDYMQDYRDFTLDKDNFDAEGGQAFLNGLHRGGQHYIPIIDAGIYHPDPKNASDIYGTFDRGKELDVFIKNPDGSDFVGKVWPGYTLFTDFMATNAQEFWTNELDLLHQEIPYDGIWIDMNEAASACNNSCGTGIVTPAAGARHVERHEGHEEISKSNDRNLELPPYVINSAAGEITDSTISPNATHASGHLEYDIHNLYGHSILRATYNALMDIFPGKRPFIIGRSTFAGSGAYAGHWGGDNWAEWYYLYASIPQALTFSLFGIPMFGVDICGFGYNTTEELCARWMELGAFMPFFRNHNTKKAFGQEPYLWPSVASASRAALHTRYTLLPYLYTLMHSASSTGSIVLRALCWEFPTDPSLASADRQFLLGPSLLVTPVLTEGAITVNGVFPGISDGVLWYDWYTGARMDAQPGENKTLDAPLEHIPIHVRGGSVLPLQEPGYTTAESRKNPFSLLIALDKTGHAEGSLYLDDGESILPTPSLEVGFNVGNMALYVRAEGDFAGDANPISNITIYGVEEWQGRAVIIAGDKEGDMVSVAEKTSFEREMGVLRVGGLEGYSQDGAWSESWVFMWK